MDNGDSLYSLVIIAYFVLSDGRTVCYPERGPVKDVEFVEGTVDRNPMDCLRLVWRGLACQVKESLGDAESDTSCTSSSSEPWKPLVMVNDVEACLGNSHDVVVPST